MIEWRHDAALAALREMSAVFWDFDGVILDSMPVRDAGFQFVLRDFPQDQVECLLAYHQANGGLSRYIKFDYFQREILQETVDQSRTATWAKEFSEYNEVRLKDPGLLIQETVRLIQHLAPNQTQFIVSGSDGQELRRIVESLGLSPYFQEVHGSPTPKTELVRDLLDRHQLVAQDCCLIGDSRNDHDAAKANGLHFCGFGNEALKVIADFYFQA